MADLTPDDLAVEALLADPRLRPPGGWSAVAEAWTDDQAQASWRHVEGERRQRRRAVTAETDAEQLYAVLEGERAQARARRSR